ncbi:hypothetical protein D9M68_731790 [compost metagenome]
MRVHQIEVDTNNGKRRYTAVISGVEAHITCETMEGFTFVVDLLDAEPVKVMLPTDKQDAKPTLECEMNGIPELPTVVAQLKTQMWLAPKERDDA